MARNIVITGFMGAGKTSVGQILADSIGYDFYDTDKLLQQQENNQSVREIFAEKGEAYFRAKEKEIVRKTALLSDCVIATGGGVVQDAQNMERLRKNGVIVYLKCSPEVVLRRVGNESDRPMIYHKSAEEVKHLMEQREKFYANHDIMIDVSAITPIDAAKAIMVAYQKWVKKEKKHVH